MEWFISNLGSMATALTFVIGGAIFIQTIRADVNRIESRFFKFESNTEKDIAELRSVLLQLARQEGKIQTIERILHIQGERLDRFMQGIIDAKTEGL
jgi:hypothetical protein